jgi:hypothetical protein
MVIGRTSFEINAASATATVFGALAGLGGITHGVGEVLQGGVPVDGLAIDSWTSGPIATNMGGEPGITVLPSAFSAGALTLAFSTAVAAWSIAGVRRKHGGLVLILLSTGMLLSGGGIGPPVMGVLAGVAGLGIGRRQGRWVPRLPRRTRRVLARAWPLLFAAGVVNAVFLVVGSVILVYAIDLNRPNLFLGSFYFAVLCLLLIVVAGRAYDTEQGEAATHLVRSRASVLKEASWPSSLGSS